MSTITFSLGCESHAEGHLDLCPCCHMHCVGLDAFKQPSFRDQIMNCT